MTAPSLRRLLVVCFAASGAAALMYQVAWVRLLTLALGHTVAATSTVLAAFMGGLALGAWAGARMTSRRRSLLAMYAGLELLVAAIAITLPTMLTAFDPLLVAAYANGTRPAVFAIARVAISLLLIGLPAAAMGATYPLVVAWLARLDGADPLRAGATSSPAGALYAANSAGAAAGALAAGFWLIELLGIRATTWVAVALNVGAALLAWWIGRNDAVLVAPLAEGKHRRRASQAQPPPINSHKLLATGAAALSGCAALVYEVAWTRLLALTLGPTTYAFATMAAAFITGIALGSAVGVGLARRGNVGFWLGTTLIGTAVCTTAGAWFTASYLPLMIARDVATNVGFGSLFLRQALAIALVILPASVCLGVTFTLAVATAAPSPDAIATHTARVYTANTLGAVGGALLAGFVFVPRFGLQRTFLHASIALVAAGMFVIGFVPESSHRRRPIRVRVVPIVGLAVLALAILGVPEWDRDLITSGAYKYSRQASLDDLDWSLRAGHLEYYKEGAAGTVSVRRVAGTRSLAIDGKVDASNAGDMLTQRLLGVLPALLHSAPRDALVIGLGSGVTADAVLASGEVERLDIVELSPEVADASTYFDRENRGVLQKPGVRLLIGDGRSHLRLSTVQYDVIVSEPSNPWMAGVAALFTREFFEAARARLRPGGIFCQWAHTYEIAETDLRSIVRTFGAVFPDGTMWLVGEGDLLLIGAAANMDARLTAVADRSQMGTVPALLADMGVKKGSAPFVLLSLLTGGPQELAAFGRGAPIQTDDRMSLEFTAARAMYAPPSGSAARLRTLAADAHLPAAVTTRTRGATAEDWTARGAASLGAGAFDVAHDSFRHGVALDSRSAQALRGATEAAAGTNNLAGEMEWLKAVAAAEPDNAAVRVELSHVLATLGRTDDAIATAADAARIDPTHAEPLEQLASVLADVGDAARLMPIADVLIARFPAREEGRFYKATALFLERRVAEAGTVLAALLKMNPGHAKGHNLRGVLCATLNDTECTRAAFTESARLNPRDPSAYINLGYFHLEQGDPATAIGFFSEALAIDATATAARQGLTDARAAQKR